MSGAVFVDQAKKQSRKEHHWNYQNCKAYEDFLDAAFHLHCIATALNDVSHWVL
jgi:hypothetical protein